MENSNSKLTKLQLAAVERAYLAPFKTLDHMREINMVLMKTSFIMTAAPILALIGLLGTFHSLDWDAIFWFILSFLFFVAALLCTVFIMLHALTTGKKMFRLSHEAAGLYEADILQPGSKTLEMKKKGKEVLAVQEKAYKTLFHLVGGVFANFFLGVGSSLNAMIYIVAPKSNCFNMVSLLVIAAVAGGCLLSFFFAKKLFFAE